MYPRLLVVPMLLVAGCTFGSGSTPDDTSDPPIPSGGEDCGQTPPEILEVWVEDGDIREYEGELYPSMVVNADSVDDDGDLHYYEMRVWWDDVVDGRVLADGAPLEVFGTLSEEECSVDEATLGMVVMLAGSPPFSSEIELGVVVEDAEGNLSGEGEPVEAVFTTPDENGDYE